MTFDPIKIEGYDACRGCSVMLPTEQLRRTQWHCYECCQSWRVRAAAIEVRSKGALVELFNKPRPRTTRRTINTQAIKHAERAAMRRLKHVFPATFALLLAEERVKRDLEAVSLLADRPAESDIEMELAYAEASFDPTAIYSVLTDQGDLNGS